MIFFFHLFSSEIFLWCGNYGVGIFLILSGYGLFCSTESVKVEFGTFFRKRGSRVLIPFAIVFLIYLLIWIALEPSGLEKIGDFAYWSLFVAGFWFIPFIFFWYVCFYLVSNISATVRSKMILLCLIGLLIIVFRPITPDPIVYWFMFPLCFPLGVVMGRYRKDLGIYFKNSSFMRKMIIGLLSIIAILLAPIIRRVVTNNFPYESIHYPLTSVLSGLGIISLMQLLLKGYRSMFLFFMGSISYEFYLIHCGVIQLFLGKSTDLFLVLAVFIISAVLSVALKCITKRLLEK